jgi:hypothetical protein
MLWSLLCGAPLRARSLLGERPLPFSFVELALTTAA